MNLINLIFIFIYLIFGIGMVKNNKYWPFFLFFYIAQLWTIFSVYYIEQGIYITEQNRFSFANGSTYRLVIQNLVFFNSALLTLYFLSRFKGKSLKLEAQTVNYNCHNKKIYNLVLYLIFIVSLLYIADAILTYFKYRGSFNRFDYYKYSILYNYPVINNLFNNVQLFPLLLGTLCLVYKNNKQKLILIISSLVLFLVSYVIQGSKFSALYLNIVLFLIPILTNMKFQLNKKTIKRLTGVIIIFVLFISLIINFSVKEYSKTLGEKEAVDFVLYRTLGLQGHVWWGTDYLSQYLNPQDKAGNLHSELNAILLKDVNQYSTGLNSLMLFVSPKIGAQFIKNGISFTMGFPAILNINFNMFGIYVSLIILGVLFGLFIYLFQKALHSLRLIYIVIFGYIYIYGMLQFFTMGRTLALFNLKVYLLFLLLIYIYICLLGMKKIRRERRKPNIGYSQKEEHLN